MSEQATMSLPMDLIKPAIDAHVQAAILTALGGSEKVIIALADRILHEKVDEKGQISAYSSCNKYEWLETQIRIILQDSIKASVREILEKDKERIKELLTKEMRKDKSQLVQAFVESMATGVVGAFASEYRINVNFVPRP